MVGCRAVTAERYYGDIATEDRRPHAVAHLAYARSQKSEAGISGAIRKSWAANDRCPFFHESHEPCDKEEKDFLVLAQKEIFF